MISNFVVFLLLLSSSFVRIDSRYLCLYSFVSLRNHQGKDCFCQFCGPSHCHSFLLKACCLGLCREVVNSEWSMRPIWDMNHLRTFSGRPNDGYIKKICYWILVIPFRYQGVCRKVAYIIMPEASRDICSWILTSRSVVIFYVYSAFKQTN